MRLLAKEQKIGFSLALIVVLIWSMNVVLTRYSIDYISPVSISFYRWMIACLLLTPFMFQKAWRIWSSINIHLFKLMLLSALGMAMT